MRGSLLAVVALAGCGGLPEYPPPAPLRGQILVLVKAAARRGVHPPRMETGYEGSTDSPASTEDDVAFTLVDYRRLKDIVVMLSGKGLDDRGPAPREAALAAGQEGFDHDLVLLAPGGGTHLTITNRTNRPLSFFSAGDEGFDVAVAPGASAAVALPRPGLYEVLCAEEERLHAEVLVAPSSYAALFSSGGHVLFDDLPPGTYEVSAIACRLPRWTASVTLAPGRRETLRPTLTVENLR